MGAYLGFIGAIFILTIHLLASATEFPNSIEIQDPENLNISTQQLIAKYKIISIGEFHGTNEAPQFTYGVLKKVSASNKNILFGVEIPESEQPYIDKFIQTKDFSALKKSPFFNRVEHDGRSSHAMAMLILKASELKNLRILCFDAENANSNQQRDTRMAENIMYAFKKNNSDIAIILAGSVHASASKGSYFDPNFHPMVYELQSLKPKLAKQDEVLSIKFEFGSGTAWACLEHRSCGPQMLTSAPTGHLNKLDYLKYLLFDWNLNNGYRAKVYFNKITHSAPLF